MPEGQKNDRFDDDELREGVEGPQQVLAGDIEEHERSQCARVRDGVDKSDVEVAIAGGEAPVFIQARAVQHERHKHQDRLQNHKLQHTLLTPPDENPACAHNNCVHNNSSTKRTKLFVSRRIRRDR